MKLEDYIKDLAPELQEKARACGSIEELVALARENKIPVPDEAIEAIAGGKVINHYGFCGDVEVKCPYCGEVDGVFRADVHHQSGYHCTRCGRSWY